MELVRSRWIRFAVGMAILMATSQGFIKVLAEVLK